MATSSLLATRLRALRLVYGGADSLLETLYIRARDRESGSREMEVASLTRTALLKWGQEAGCEEVARAAVLLTPR